LHIIWVETALNWSSHKIKNLLRMKEIFFQIKWAMQFVAQKGDKRGIHTDKTR
jgi:hypothetical protein